MDALWRIKSHEKFRFVINQRLGRVYITSLQIIILITALLWDQQ